jgi:small subunit ribosomal protein S17
MRNDRKTVVGKVTSDKGNKTITVSVERRIKAPKFGKYIRKFTKCYAHDENNEARTGDQVEIMESRPVSKNKSWRLVKVLSRGEE